MGTPAGMNTPTSPLPSRRELRTERRERPFVEGAADQALDKLRVVAS